MQAAAVFGKLPTVGTLTGVTIDASALYLLAKPSVPQEVQGGEWGANNPGIRTHWRSRFGTEGGP